MPYIKPELRKMLDKPLHDLWDTLSELSTMDLAGGFTYVVYSMLKRCFAGKFFLRALGIGCMVCAVLEWYRKSCAPYEDEKERENGSV